MEKHSYKKLLVYLENFRRNYIFFTIYFSGKHLTLHLDQFTHDQAKMAQVVYGDHGARMVKELAKKLSNNE